MHSLSKIWKNRRNIWEGLWNSMFSSKPIKKMALERKVICEVCPHLDKTGDKCFVPGTQPCCSLCGCKMAWKWFAPKEDCDDNRWPTPQE